MTQSSAQPQSVPVREETAARITLHEAPTERSEAEFIVKTLEQLLGGHSFFSIDSGRSSGDGEDWSFADFAILYRTEAQAPALIEALDRSGMPFQRRSHSRLLDYPGAPLLIDALQQGEESGGDLIGQIERAVQTAAQAVEGETEAMLVEAGELLKPLAEVCGADKERFLAELSVGAQVDTWDPRADRIALLTLHAAKGLEFPVVFIVGCEDGVLPLTWGEATDADLDEERRLFYVGVTRAQTRLYLCHARKRLWRGQVRPMTPSPYLSDIEERLLARQRTQLAGERTSAKRSQLELFS